MTLLVSFTGTMTLPELLTHLLRFSCCARAARDDQLHVSYSSCAQAARDDQLNVSYSSCVQAARDDQLHVLEHTLHQLLRKHHVSNKFVSMPHPVTSLIGMSKRRRLAGPAGFSRAEIADLKHRYQRAGALHVPPFFICAHLML